MGIVSNGRVATIYPSSEGVLNMMDRRDERQDALAALAERLAMLERGALGARRRTRLTPWVALAAALVGALVGRFGFPEPRVFAQDKDKAGVMEVTCSALKVVDEQGKVRVQLGFDKSGGIVSINNADGKPQVAVKVDQEGGFVSVASHDGVERAFVGVNEGKSGGLVYLKDDKDKHRAYFGIAKQGHGGLSFSNPQGKNEIFIGTSTQGLGGLFNINAPDGRSRIIMDITKEGYGAFEMLNNDQKAEVYIGSSAKGWGGLFNLNSPSGAASVILDIDETSWGRLNLRDKSAKMFLYAGADADGGALRAFAHDGKERAFFGVGDKQSGGLIYLLNPDNAKARMVIGVDESGVGYAEGRDEGGVTKRALPSRTP